MNPQPVPATPLPRRRSRAVENPYNPREAFAGLGRLYRDTQAKGTAAAARAARRPGNRYNPHPATGDPEYTAEQLEFLRAVAAWRQASRKPFPTNVDLLEILKGMGYVRVPHGYRLVPVAADGAPPPLRVVAAN